MANLLKRDEKELMGKESIGSSVYNEFGAAETVEADDEQFPEAFHSAGATLLHCNDRPGHANQAALAHDLTLLQLVGSELIAGHSMFRLH